MKIEFEWVPEDPGSSFRLLHQKLPAEKYSWQFHYHPEYELVCILAGNGTRQVGNHVSNYENGDLILMAPNLPHSGFGLNATGIVEQVVIQYKEELLGSSLLMRPELQQIRALFEKAKFGISFTGATKEKVSKRLMRLLKMGPFDRLIELVSILQILAKSDEYILLNSKATLPASTKKIHARLQNIFNYAEQNFQEEINIRKVAGIAHLTVPAFCNYFKKIMNMTFTDFINQYRIEQACVLLQQDKSIGDVCFDCGFNNVPYFNKVFKKITKKTPSEFIKSKLITR
jgi:AraC-like DNA-binding protein